MKIGDLSLKIDLLSNVLDNEEPLARIELKYVNDDIFKTIIDIKWNPFELVDWWKDSKEIIATEKYPFYNPENKCLAELISDAWNRTFFFSEDEFYEFLSKVDDYFCNHEFHLRGTTFPVVYIGLNPDSIGEISFYDKKQGCFEKYFFSMTKFIDETEKEVKKLAGN